MLASKHVLKKTLLEFSQSDGGPPIWGVSLLEWPVRAVPLKTITKLKEKLQSLGSQHLYSLCARCLSVASSSLARAPMLGGNSQRGLVTYPQKKWLLSICLALQGTDLRTRCHQS